MFIFLSVPEEPTLGGCELQKENQYSVVKEQNVPSRGLKRAGEHSPAKSGVFWRELKVKASKKITQLVGYESMKTLLEVYICDNRSESK
jgi:hypothetical protein